MIRLITISCGSIFYEPEGPRKKGIIHWGKGVKKRRQKIAILNSFVTNVLPKNVAGVVETSVNKAIDWAERLKQAKLKIKEGIREKLLRLNAKIGKLLEKPRFEFEEEKSALNNFAREFAINPSNGDELLPPKDFLKEVKSTVIDLLEKK